MAMNEHAVQQLMTAYGERKKLLQLKKVSDPRFWALLAERATPAGEGPNVRAVHPDEQMLSALGDEVSFGQWMNDVAHMRLNSLIHSVENRIRDLGGEV